MIAPTRHPDDSTQPNEAGPRVRRSWRWLPWLIGAALLATVIVAALHFAEAEEFAQLVERAEPWWFLLAVALQVATYLEQGEVFRYVARAGGSSLGLGLACRLSLSKLFVDQAVPTAGLSGTVVLANGLERDGMPRPVVAAAIVVDLASYYFAYVICLAVALAIAEMRGEASAVVLLVFAVFFAFAIGLSVVVLALSGRSAREWPRWLSRLRPLRTMLEFVQQANPRLARSARILFVTSVWQLAIVLSDAATVWILLLSLGAEGSVSGVFASFMLSSLLRTIGIMPGGLGTYEAASVLTLRLVGVPLTTALAGTLLFRGLSFWLPMLPGLWFSRHAMRRPAQAA